MPVGGFAMATAPAADEDEVTPKSVKTSFTVFINSF